MNIIEAEKFIKNAYPNKEISYEFNDNCLHRVTYYFENGNIKPDCIAFYTKALFHIENQEDIYIDIKPHSDGKDPMKCLIDHAKLEVETRPSVPNME